MNAIFEKLPPGSRILDLGSGGGSFDARTLPAIVVRADLSPAGTQPDIIVACAAWALPFTSRSFKAVILNHSLEHFENLSDCVAEIARVLAEDGLLYIAVPDASTLTDRLYRWLARGGGHVNLFRDPRVITDMITAATGLEHSGTRLLHSSLAFLNRKNLRARPPRKLLLFGNGHEGLLRWLSWCLRRLDRRFGWRLSVYGWAFYFGAGIVPEEGAWSNVCVGCGSGHPSSLLKPAKRWFRPGLYACPQCGTWNCFTEDEGTAANLELS